MAWRRQRCGIAAITSHGGVIHSSLITAHRGPSDRPGWMAMDTGVGGLPGDVEDLLRREKGYLTTAVAAAAGVDRNRLRRLTNAGLLVRAAQGCYVDGASFASMDDWARYRTKARAFATACGDGAFLTGWSAVVNWWLPTIGAPPRRPTVVRAKSSGWGATVTEHGRTLVADLPAEHCLQVGAYGLMSPAWAVADLARTAPVAHALVVADAAVRMGADLDAVLPHMRRWVGAARSRWVADHAEPNIESPLRPWAGSPASSSTFRCRCAMPG